MLSRQLWSIRSFTLSLLLHCFLWCFFFFALFGCFICLRCSLSACYYSLSFSVFTTFLKIFGNMFFKGLFDKEIMLSISFAYFFGKIAFSWVCSTHRRKRCLVDWYLRLVEHRPLLTQENFTNVHLFDQIWIELDYRSLYKRTISGKCEKKNTRRIKSFDG